MAITIRTIPVLSGETAQRFVEMAEAMQRFYASKTYQQLQQENTKLWHLGAVGLYELFCEA